MKTGEQGFVLVGALLVLLLLVLIGISATTTTTLELQIAGAERIRRETFYNADAGVELATRLLEENWGCLVTQDGFTPTAIFAGTQVADLGTDLILANRIRITDITLADATDSRDPTDTDPTVAPNIGAGATTPSDTDRDAFFPSNAQAAVPPYTNFKIERTTAEPTAPEGTSMRQVTGYEHKGAGAGAGGGSGFYFRYHVQAQHQGLQNSEAIIHVRWRHVVGLEVDCSY